MFPASRTNKSKEFVMADMHTPLWAVSIQGPDDLVAAADYLTAVRVANAFNEWWAALKTEQPLHKFDPRMWAVPVEWVGDIASHTECAAKPSPDYAPFFEARASQDAETIKALEAKLKAIRNKIPMSYLRRHDVAGATGPTSECDIVAAMADFSADRWKIIGRIAAKDAALDECETYFDNRSDVSDGDYGIPEPNAEMRLLSTVRAALAGSAS